MVVPGDVYSACFGPLLHQAQVQSTLVCHAPTGQPPQCTAPSCAAASEAQHSSSSAATTRRGPAIGRGAQTLPTPALRLEAQPTR